MKRFMCLHTLPPNAMTREQVEEIAKASQNDPVVHGIRSFINLSEGKACCVWDSPDKQALATWFDRMKLPYDAIIPVELEGEHGTICEVETPVGAQAPTGFPDYSDF